MSEIATAVKVETRMIQKSYTVRFLTPAFLGNAEQSGQWRTPPLKHLLREWWRVAAAPDFGYDYQKLREAEGRLFGHAWLNTDRDNKGNKVSGRKSKVLLRLDKWDLGKTEKWDADLLVRHPEVGDGGRNVGAHLYLGYGPLTYNRNSRSTSLKANAAIQSGESAAIRLAFPGVEGANINKALRLIHLYGTVGGRSRNGWGSLELDPSPSGSGEGVFRDWVECLQLEWPHAIGKDNSGALIWKTKEFDEWKSLMQELARIKIGLRTQFPFHAGRNAPNPEKRHWISYPVTYHSVKGWGNKRLPNTLRFKMRKDANGKLYGLIFHIPCRPPGDFKPDGTVLERLWSEVHQHLDGKLGRIAE